MEIDDKYLSDATKMVAEHVFPQTRLQLASCARYPKG